LCGLRHRFGPTVCIKLCEYRSDMKLDGMERNAQSTGDRFVRSTVCHRGKYFELAARQSRVLGTISLEPVIINKAPRKIFLAKSLRI
jgi:hypothetical protein